MAVDTPGGILVYRCRRCDATFGTTDVRDAQGDLTSIVEGYNLQGTGMHTIHQCSDGHLGVADLVGCVLDSHEEALLGVGRRPLAGLRKASIRALEVLQQHGPLQPREFARLTWPQTWQWSMEQFGGDSSHLRWKVTAARGFLGRLVKGGWVQKDLQTGRYSLTALGRSALAQVEFRERVEP